jgi:hypothetical protein
MNDITFHQYFHQAFFAGALRAAWHVIKARGEKACGLMKQMVIQR